MKKIALSLLSLSLLGPQLLGGVVGTTDVTTTIEVGQGFRYDKLKTSVRGYHKHPNILSQLDAKHMSTYLTTLKGTVSNGTYIGSVDLAYGDILNGSMSKAFYREDNRRGESHRFTSKVNGNYSWDVSAKVGRIFSVWNDATFTPSLGYGAFFQHLDFRKIYVSAHERMDGYETDINHKRIHHLRVVDNTRWLAPFVNLMYTQPITRSLKMDLGYSFFYPVHFVGKDHAHVHAKPIHFRTTERAKTKDARSIGQREEIQFRWACVDRLELGLGFAASEFVARDGRLHHSRGGSLPFRRATRITTDYLLSLAYSF